MKHLQMVKTRKVFLLSFFVCAMAVSAVAQGYHFVYIQADGQQPFYLKYNGKNYSSSSIGYLILPRLNDGSFTVQIGFPKNLFPEQTFNLAVAGKDYGYALKNFADKGWGLFNFQTTDIVMNVNSAASETAPAQTVVNNTSNPFGNMLADAINDSTLNQQRIGSEVTATKKILDSTFQSIKDSVNAASQATNKGRKVSQPYSMQSSVDSLVKVYSQTDTALITKNESSGAGNITTDTSKGIVKSAENTTSSGTDITFLDNAGKDTIHAFIPSSDSVATVKRKGKSKNKADNPFFNGNTTSDTITKQPVFVDTTTSASITANTVTNSNCQTMISSYDIDKLRKKIAKADKQDEILAAIKKALRNKCLTTEQVKDFGNLFSSDENRYNFYDAVYPFVSDYFNFPQLQSTLADTYYKNRFKALLR